MCQCLCSYVKGHDVFAVGDAFVCSDVYMGCGECAQVIGVDIHVFNDQGVREWVPQSAPCARVIPDEYGGGVGGGAARSIPILTTEALGMAMAESGARTPEDYDTWEDWFNDYGLEVIQRAINLTRSEKVGL